MNHINYRDFISKQPQFIRDICMSNVIEAKPQREYCDRLFIAIFGKDTQQSTIKDFKKTARYCMIM